MKDKNLSRSSDIVPAMLFDLDGTLIDSVYQHVLAWREALERAGTQLSVWRIDRRIGMSGGLLINAVLRETGHEITGKDAASLQQYHAEAYAKLVSQVRPLPGAVELLSHLAKSKVPYAIATSGVLESARPSLEALRLEPGVRVITRDQVRHAKPDPDLFLAAADQLGVSIHDSVVVGDSVWDLLAAQRARALGVGVLPVAMGKKNSSERGLTAYTRILSILCSTWTKSAFASRTRRNSVFSASY